MKAFKNINLVTTTETLKSKAVIFDEKIISIVDEASIPENIEIKF